MTILQTVPYIGNESSGPSYSVPGLCRGLQTAGCEVGLFFAGPRPDRSFSYPVTTAPIRSFPTRRLGRSPELYRRLLAAAETADVIHNNSFWMFPNVYGYRAIQSLKFKVQSLKFKVQSSKFKVQSLKFKVQSLKFKVQSLKFKVQSSKFKVQSLKVPKLVNAPRGTLAAWSLRHHALQKKFFGWFTGQYAAMQATDMWHATSEKEYEEIRAAGFKQPVAIVPIGMDLPNLPHQRPTANQPTTKFQLSTNLLTANDRHAAAEMKVAEWLAGVDEASFEAALVSLVEAKSAAGEYRFRKSDDRELALNGARRFFREFARKIIPLSDGRYVYFAPDARAKMRNASNALSWAEYAFHAVSSSGKLLDGKNFRERLYNPMKTADLPYLEGVIRSERCMYRLIDAYPENDAVIFVGQDEAYGRLEVVTRLDQFGNAEANLGEVTVIAQHRRRGDPPPKSRPLTEVVEAVAKHQAAGFSPSTTALNVSYSADTRKGENQLPTANQPATHTIAFFGRLHTVKRIDLLLRAWELLTSPHSNIPSFKQSNSKHQTSNFKHQTSNFKLQTLNFKLQTSNWELVIAGPDGGVRAELESYTASHHLPRVRFVGEINGPAKYDFLSSADLYVLPSSTENFGVTLAEALACGTPALGSKGTPWKELNEWKCGSWGFDTAEELAGELAKLMALSDEERAAMGKRGQDLIRTNYSWEGVGRKMKAAYEWLCHGGDRPEWVRVD